MTLSLGLWAAAHGGAALAGFALVFGGAHGTFVGLTGATAAELFGVLGSVGVSACCISRPPSAV